MHVEVAADPANHEKGLEVREHPDRGGLAQEWVCQGLALALLIVRREDRLACRVVHRDGAVVEAAEAFRCERRSGGNRTLGRAWSQAQSIQRSIVTPSGRFSWSMVNS